MPDLDTNYVRERQPPCDCGTCEIWKSLHDEALTEIDRLRELELQAVGYGMPEHQQEQGMMDDDSGIADFEAKIEQRTKEAILRSVHLAHGNKAQERGRGCPLTLLEVDQAIKSAGRTT